MRVAIVGPVYPYRGGIAYCTTRLARELNADVVSFKRLYPERFYPGEGQRDPSLPHADADFVLDILNPLTWLRARRKLRSYDAVIFVWWIWVWAIPYRVMTQGLRRVILQCHNICEKEPAWWKRALTDLVLRRGDVLVVHAKSEAEEAMRRLSGAPPPSAAPAGMSAGAPQSERVVTAFLPVHELGGIVPPRADARRRLGIEKRNVALLFGHLRPFKGVDIALDAWRRLKSDVLLVIAGEPWWKFEYATQANVRFDLRFIPDREVADYFAATDVVIAPYRAEAQSGVAMTAFHFARPVIATRVGGLPDIIDGENGILVPPENSEALAAAVDEFFTRRDRAAMERAAAESAKRYSWAEYGAIMKGLVERP